MLSFEADKIERLQSIIRAEVVDGTRITLSDIEFYPTGFIVSFGIRHLELPGSLIKDVYPTASWSASDDVGTAYAGDLLDVGEQLFSPRVPRDASKLTLVANEIHWTGRNFKAAAIDPGPWRFEIALT